MIEIVSGRLYLAREDVFGKADIESATVIVDLSSNAKVTNSGAPAGAMYVRWDVGDDVEERMFEALVRFCAGIMRSPKQIVLIVGHHDTIDVIAACVLREYLGCKPEIAVSILRAARPKCLSKPDLLETLINYKIS